MKVRNWLILAVAAIVAVAGAAYLIAERSKETAVQEIEGALFPGLLAEVNSAAKIKVRNKDQNWEIRRTDAGNWVMSSKHDYPVSADKVKKAVVALADLKLLEAKTSKPELYKRIGVTDVEAEGSQAILVEIADAADKDLGKLLIGKTRKFETGATPAEVYVRKPDAAESWLVQARLNVQVDPIEWLVRETIKVNKGQVNRITTTHADGESFTIERQKAEVEFLQLQQIPDGKKLTSTQRIGSIGAALEFLGFEDVLPLSEKDMGAATTTEFETKDGMRITVQSLVEGEAYWTSFDVIHDPILAEEGTDAEQVAKEVEAINQRVAGWVYLLPEHRGRNFARRLDDLIEDVEKPEQAATEDQ